MRFNDITISECKNLILNNKEGITININGSLPNKKAGYYVSVTNNTFNSVHFIDIYKLILQAALYERSHKIKTFIGSWYSKESNKWYIDLSLWFSNKDHALIIAKQYGQEAIFDIKRLDSIYLN